MLFYIVLFVIFLSLSFGDLTDLSEKDKIRIFRIAVVTWIILGSIRFATGTDWGPYYNYFMNNNTYDEFLHAANFEYGYALLNYLVKQFSDSYHVFLLVMTSIICILKYKAALRLSPFPLMTLGCWFAYSFGNIFSIRQDIAIAITLFSICAIQEEKCKKFILLVILATFFHQSSICFLPAYWIYHSSFSIKKWSLLFIGALLIGYFDLIVKGITAMAGLDFSLTSKFLGYANNPGANYGSNIDAGIRGALSLLKKGWIVFVYILARAYIRSSNQNKEKYDGLLNLSCFSFLIAALFMNIPEISMRLTAYYALIDIYTIPFILLAARNMKQKRVIWIMIVGYCAVKYTYQILNMPGAFIPYKTDLF